VSVFDVHHQPRAQRIVQHALSSGRLPHAYLFHGPDGVGKEMMADRLAGILLCARPVHPQGSPIEELAGFDGALCDACGECQDCVLVRAGTHPDLHLIYRELHKHHPESKVRSRKGLDLSVDVVRHFVIDAVGTKPARGRAKVFVIRQADRITPAAQNALLKTLEEPPPTTFLILLSASLDKLLATTKSRCQPVPFVPLPTDFVAAKLAELIPDISPELAGSYAAIAQGSLGTALCACQDGLDSYNAKIIEALGHLGTAPVTKIAGDWLDDAKALGVQFGVREKGISDTEAQRRGLRALFLLLATWFSDLLRISVGCETDVVNSGYAGRLAAAGVSADQAALAIRAIADAERNLDRNASTQLIVEALVTRLSRIAPATHPVV